MRLEGAATATEAFRQNPGIGVLGLRVQNHSFTPRSCRCLVLMLAGVRFETEVSPKFKTLLARAKW